MYRKYNNVDGPVSVLNFLLIMYLTVSLVGFFAGLVDSKILLYGSSPCEEDPPISYVFPAYILGCMLGR
jgi:hypothetical protein